MNQPNHETSRGGSSAGMNTGAADQNAGPKVDPKTAQQIIQGERDAGREAARHAGERDREAIRQASEIGQTGQRPDPNEKPLPGSRPPTLPTPRMITPPTTPTPTPTTPPPSFLGGSITVPGRDAAPAKSAAGCCSGSLATSDPDPQSDDQVNPLTDPNLARLTDPHLTPPTPTTTPTTTTKPATEKQVDSAVAESFPASDATSTQREKPGAGDAPPDLRHRLPPHGTDAEREAVEQARESH